MTTLEIILLTIIATSVVIFMGFKLKGTIHRPQKRDRSPVWKLGNVTNEEDRCLRLAERRWRKPLLHYLRTLEASPDLQNYLVENKDCLKEVRRFLGKHWNVGQLTSPRSPIGRQKLS